MKNKTKQLVVILSLLTIVTMSIALTGCLETEKNESNPSVQLDSNEENNDFSFQMETLYDSDIFGGVTVYRNTVTDVLYLWISDNTYKGGLTEMSDPETGLPLTYERYMELYAKTVQN